MLDATCPKPCSQAPRNQLTITPAVASTGTTTKASSTKRPCFHRERNRNSTALSIIPATSPHEVSICGLLTMSAPRMLPDQLNATRRMHGTSAAKTTQLRFEHAAPYIVFCLTYSSPYEENQNRLSLRQAHPLLQRRLPDVHVFWVALSVFPHLQSVHVFRESMQLFHLF